MPNPALDTIPLELRELKRWIVYRDELVDGQTVRRIYTPVTGEPASLDDSSTWGTYEDVVAAYERGWGGDL